MPEPKTLKQAIQNIDLPEDGEAVRDKAAALAEEWEKKYNDHIQDFVDDLTVYRSLMEQAGIPQQALFAGMFAKLINQFHESRAEVERLTEGMAAVYQYFGAIDAPEWILDNTAELASGRPAPHAWKAWNGDKK